MIGSMNDYRPLSGRFRLGVPYAPCPEDWRTAVFCKMLTSMRKAFAHLHDRPRYVRDHEDAKV